MMHEQWCVAWLHHINVTDNRRVLQRCNNGSHHNSHKTSCVPPVKTGNSQNTGDHSGNYLLFLRPTSCSPASKHIEPFGLCPGFHCFSQCHSASREALQCRSVSKVSRSVCFTYKPREPAPAMAKVVSVTTGAQSTATTLLLSKKLKHNHHHQSEDVRRSQLILKVYFWLTKIPVIIFLKSCEDTT